MPTRSTIFNETTLLPYQRIRVMDNGTEKWAKVYYWQENGVRRYKVLPANDREENHPPEIMMTKETIPLIYSIAVETILPANEEPETFSFFGLHNDIRIAIDPNGRLPLKSIGTNSSIGPLVLDLQEVPWQSEYELNEVPE